MSATKISIVADTYFVADTIQKKRKKIKIKIQNFKIIKKWFQVQNFKIQKIKKLKNQNNYKIKVVKCFRIRFLNDVKIDLHIK